MKEYIFIINCKNMALPDPSFEGFKWEILKEIEDTAFDFSTLFSYKDESKYMGVFSGEKEDYFLTRLKEIVESYGRRVVVEVAYGSKTKI